MKEHVISSRDCLAESIDGEQETTNEVEGRTNGADVNIGSSGQGLTKGGGLAH